jgi:hypothetical protein
MIVEIPDMAAFEQLAQAEVGAESAQYDGVRTDTMVMLTEA